MGIRRFTKNITAIAILFLGSSWLSQGLSAKESQRTARSPAKFLLDPSTPDVGWLLWEDRLEFNSRLTRGGKWSRVFDKEVFRKITGDEVSVRYRQKKIWISNRTRGRLFLYIENPTEEEPKKSFLLSTDDHGRSWRFKMLGSRKVASPAEHSPTPVKVTEKEPAPAVHAKSAEEVVDLSAMDSAPASATGSVNSLTANAPKQVYPGHGPHGGAITAPVFKVYFDFLLNDRPGALPLTFDNFHTLLLADVIPRPDFQFSFEVNPTPRYFELDYKPFPRLTLRAGKIWIPFDDMGPHNYFGGHINTSRLAQPNASSYFLPDIWAELGVGIRYDFLETSAVNITGDFYVVNGFGSGGTDPKGEITGQYPNFFTVGGVDNNNDKSIGARLHLDIDSMLGLGASVYRGKYNNQADSSAGVLMLGLDAQLRLSTGTNLRAGYTYMYVDLPTGASSSNFLRGGGYIGLSQKFLRNWVLSFQGGMSQNDNRVIDVSDQTTLGALLMYDLTFAQLSLHHYHDFAVVPGKLNYEFSAFRIVVLL